MSSDPRTTYRLLRELGSRAKPTFAAIREPYGLVVLHRFARSDLASADVTAVSSEELASLHRDAQAIAKHWHQNVPRVKHVELTDGNLAIATELIEGATLADLLATASRRVVSFPLDVVARILLDVLAGLHSLHTLSDAKHQRLSVIHGELCPTNIVVGRDGIARIINVLRPRPVRIGEGSEALAHAPPESLDDGASDARADVYAVGVILWEILSGKKLHHETKPTQLLARLREMELTRPAAPADASYAPLVDIAMRALSFEPALRFRTAGEMATEIRKVRRIAAGSAVAARVNELEGERIRGRRAALERTTSGRPGADTPAIEMEDDDVVPSTSDTEPAPPMPEAIDPSEVDVIFAEAKPPPVPAPKSLIGLPPAPPPWSASSSSNAIVIAPLPFTEASVPPATPATTSGLTASVDVELSDASDAGTGRKRRGLLLVIAAAAALLVSALALGFRSHPSDSVAVRSPIVEAPTPKQASSVTVAEPPRVASVIGTSTTPATPPSSSSERTTDSASESTTPPTSAPARAAAAASVPTPVSTLSASSAPRPSTRRYEPLGI